MLVLSRRVDEEICIGEDIRLLVLSIQGGKVRLGVEAPAGVRIMRKELLLRDEIRGEMRGEMAGAASDGGRKDRE